MAAFLERYVPLGCSCIFFRIYRSSSSRTLHSSIVLSVAVVADVIVKCIVVLRDNGCPCYMAAFLERYVPLGCSCIIFRIYRSLSCCADIFWDILDSCFEFAFRLPDVICFLWYCVIRFLHEKQSHYAVAISVRPSIRSSVRVFYTFSTCLLYQFETWYRYSVGCMTHRVWVSSELGHLTYFTAKDISNYLFAFTDFFLHVLRYQIETWYIHSVGGTTH